MNKRKVSFDEKLALVVLAIFAFPWLLGAAQAIVSDWAFNSSQTEWEIRDSSGNPILIIRNNGDKSIEMAGRVDVNGPLVANSVINSTGQIETAAGVKSATIETTGTATFGGDVTVKGSGTNSLPTLDIANYNDQTAFSSVFEFFKSHTDTPDSLVTTIDQELIGRIDFYGVDVGNNKDIGARIDVRQNGAAGVKVPVDMIFSTNSSTGANSNQFVLDNDGSCTFSGDVWGAGDASFITFTDRSRMPLTKKIDPKYESALDKIKKFKPRSIVDESEGFARIDKESLPAELVRESTVIKHYAQIVNRETGENVGFVIQVQDNTTNVENVLAAGDLVVDSTEDLIVVNTEAEEIERGRDIGMSVSLNMLAIQELLERVEALEEENLPILDIK